MHQHRLIPAVNIISLVVIGLLSFQFRAEWCQFRKDSGRKISAEKVLYEAKSTERRPRGYYSIIEERNIFGETGLSHSGKLESGVVSSFRLRGTVLLSSGGGYAILEDVATGMQRLYKLGDKVGNSSLASIKWGRVSLKDSGGDKVLAMVSPASREVGKTENKEKEIQQVAQNKRIISSSFVEETVASANQILTQVRVKPHFVSGVSEGYWVGNIQPGSIIEEMGFQNGDIIKRINGQDLDSPEKILQVYQEVKTTGAITVDVERDNQITTMTYEIRD